MGRVIAAPYAAQLPGDLGAEVIKIEQPVEGDMRQAFDDPQVRHRGMAVEVPHPFAGMLKLVINPLRFSETPITGYTAPAQIGEHTDAVLKDVLGIDTAEINRLCETCAIQRRAVRRARW